MDIQPRKDPKQPKVGRTIDMRPTAAKTDVPTDGALVETPTKPVESPAPKVSGGVVTSAKRRWYKRIGWWWLAIVLAIIALAGAGVWYALASTKPHAVAVSKGPAAPVKPVTVPDPLTGLPVSADAAAKPIIGVMIENLDPDARPQSGLGSAGVVYEALAEGGITRFLALFQEPVPASIGPVRSLRPYYLDWALEYDVPVAHAGGSIPALNAVGSLGSKDINALAYDGSYFFRTKDKAAPHNLFTSDVLLEKLDSVLGFDKAPSFTPIARKKDTPAVGVAPHPTIDINFSYSDYAVEYKYDAKSNSYARFMAGAPHLDKNTGQQIMVKNVVVEYVTTSYSTQSNGKPETDIADVGSGKALVFTDGTVTAATWSKAASAAQTKLTDVNGKPVQLNNGNTWYSVVPTTNVVTY